MKLTVNRKALSEILKQAASVAKGIGLLSNVRLSCQAQVSGGMLDIEAVSSSEACRLSVPVDGELREGGEVLVEAKRLSDFVALDSAETLTLKLDRSRLTVTGRSTVHLSTLPVGDFPALPDPKKVTDWLSIPAECLFQAFPRPQKVASTRMANGCSSSLLVASGGLVRAYGNGAALVYRAGSVCEAPEGLELELVVPAEAGRHGFRGGVEVGAAGGWFFVIGEGVWAFRQPEERHPAYESLPVWHEERQPEAMLSADQAEELLAGIKAMATVSELGELRVMDGEIMVSVRGDVQSGEWRMDGVDTFPGSNMTWFGSLEQLAKGLYLVAEEGVGFELHEANVSGMVGLRAKNALDEQVWIGGMKR